MRGGARVAIRRAPVWPRAARQWRAGLRVGRRPSAAAAGVRRRVCRRLAVRDGPQGARRQHAAPPLSRGDEAGGEGAAERRPARDAHAIARRSRVLPSAAGAAVGRGAVPPRQLRRRARVRVRLAAHRGAVRRQDRRGRRGRRGWREGAAQRRPRGTAERWH
eukprot:6605877-Prymnesium_polylepis.1